MNLLLRLFLFLTFELLLCACSQTQTAKIERSLTAESADRIVTCFDKTATATAPELSAAAVVEKLRTQLAFLISGEGSPDTVELESYRTRLHQLLFGGSEDERIELQLAIENLTVAHFFAVKTVGKPIWIGAGAPISTLTKTDKVYLLPTAASSLKGGYSETTVGAVSLMNGVDVASVADSKLTYVNPLARESINGLELRDLVREPLLFNENLFLADFNRGRLRVISCMARGLNFNTFKLDSEFEFQAQCQRPKGGRVSSGIFLDQKARVIGPFLGATANASKYLSGIPIFDLGGKALSVQPRYSDASPVQQCFACYKLDRRLNDADFVANPAKYQMSCVLRYLNNGRRVEFVTTQAK